MKIGIGKLILFILCLIIFINDVWILNVFNISKDWLAVIIGVSTFVSGVAVFILFLAFFVSGIAVFILFLAFLIKLWEAK